MSTKNLRNQLHKYLSPSAHGKNIVSLSLKLVRLIMCRDEEQETDYLFKEISSSIPALQNVVEVFQQVLVRGLMKTSTEIIYR